MNPFLFSILQQAGQSPYGMGVSPPQMQPQMQPQSPYTIGGLGGFGGIQSYLQPFQDLRQYWQDDPSQTYYPYGQPGSQQAGDPANLSTPVREFLEMAEPTATGQLAIRQNYGAGIGNNYDLFSPYKQNWYNTQSH